MATQAKRKENEAIYRRLLWSLAAFFLVSYLGMRFLGTVDFTYVLMWWAILLVLGMIMQPLTIVIFERFHDGGWVFAKALGVAVCGWLMWFLSSIHILKFTRTACFFVGFLCFAIGMVLFYFLVLKKNRSYRFATFYTRKRLCSMFASEAMFFAVFTFWCYLKGINPAAFGTERFMDYGFVLSIFKSDYMPPKDIWFAGGSINYYYMGQYMAAFLAKISGVPVTHGYNIAMMMLPAFGFCMPYSIVCNVIKTRLCDRQAEVLGTSELRRAAELGEALGEKEPFYRPALGGVLAGAAVAFSSNMHYPIYKYIVPKFQQILGKEEIYKYWFPDATRYIGYFPSRDDKTIHEFPLYSYVLGDLHAHVFNTIFVMTVIAILFTVLLRRKERLDSMRMGGTMADMPNRITEIFHPSIITAAFLIGMFKMTNYWDFPIYFVVSGAILLFSNLLIYSFTASAWIVTAYQAAVFIVTGIVVSLPFTLTFDSISTGIGITFRHTLLREMLVLWGLPLCCLLVYFIVSVREERKNRRKDNNRPFIARFLASMHVSDLFFMTIALCAAGLVLLPEIIYVRDIYSGAYERANTMFKLTYQAYIMFGMSMAYIICRFIYLPKSRFQKGFGCVALVLLCMTTGYFDECFNSWFTGRYSTLDASAFLSGQNKDDAEMIAYINDNIEGQPVIAEMCGLSYTFFNRVSVFTGNPTIVGWRTHEWLWRCSGTLDIPEEIPEREADIRTLYSSQNSAEIRAVLDKYNVDYIYVGECESVFGYSQAAVGENTDYQTVKSIGGTYYTKLESNLDILLTLGEIEKVIPANDKKKYATYLIRVTR